MVTSLLNRIVRKPWKTLCVRGVMVLDVECKFRDRDSIPSDCQIPRDDDDVQCTIGKISTSTIQYNTIVHKYLTKINNILSLPFIFSFPWNDTYCFHFQIFIGTVTIFFRHTSVHIICDRLLYPDAEHGTTVLRRLYLFMKSKHNVFTIGNFVALLNLCMKSFRKKRRKTTVWGFSGFLFL